MLQTCHNINEDPKYLKDWRKTENLLKTVQENQNRSSEKIVLSHKNKHPTSYINYLKGDTVIVKITKSDKKNERQREKICYKQGRSCAAIREKI